MAAASKALEANPADPKQLAARADARVRLGEYAAAAADYEQAVALAPDDHFSLFRLACLRAYLRDDAGYRAVAGALLAKSAAAGADRPLAGRAAKVCLLFPTVAGDPTAVTAAVKAAGEQALAPGAPQYLVQWLDLLRGMAEYRSGRFAEAVRPLEQAQANITSASGRLTAAAYLAACYHLLDQTDNARRLLAETLGAVAAEVPTAADDISGVENWLILQVALREVRAAIPPPPAGRPPTRPAATGPASRSVAGGNYTVPASGGGTGDARGQVRACLHVVRCLPGSAISHS